VMGKQRQVLSCLLLLPLVQAEAGPKGHAEPWDWQKQYPVFQPYTKSEHELPHQPEFLHSPRNLSVEAGSSTTLPCRVKNLFQHYTVSWIRARDVTVLSVGHLLFSSDKRFSVLEVPRPRLAASDWSLTIVNASRADQGVYECQVNTDPKMNRKFYLEVKEDLKETQGDSPYYRMEKDEPNQAPLTGYEKTHSKLKKHQDLSNEEAGFPMWLHEDGCICPRPPAAARRRATGAGPHVAVTGGEVHYVTEGGSLGLECLVSGLPSPPLTLHWKRDGQVVTARNSPGLSLETDKLAGVSRSDLVLARAQLQDTGNYTCVTDGGREAAVLLVVSRGPSGMARSGRQARSSGTSITSIFSFTYLTSIFLSIILAL